MNKQKGFGALGIILTIVVVLAIGFAGWYVWKNNSDKTDEPTETSQQPNYESEDQNTEVVDPFEGWTEITNEAGAYTFKYPAEWVKGDVPTEFCPTVTLLAANMEALGKCPSSQAGQVMVASGNCEFSEADAEYFKNVRQSSVTVDGVSGTMTTGTVEGMDGIVFEGSLPDDTKIVCYQFSANGRDYQIQYTQRPTFQDISADLHKMVTQTFKFL